VSVKKLLKRINLTTIIVTHDSYEAFSMADKCGIILNQQLKQYDLPIATIVGKKPVNKTPAGHKIKMCPNQINKAITCQLCLMCSKNKRNYIVGFLKD